MNHLDRRTKRTIGALSVFTLLVGAGCAAKQDAPGTSRELAAAPPTEVTDEIRAPGAEAAPGAEPRGQELHAPMAPSAEADDMRIGADGRASVTAARRHDRSTRREERRARLQARRHARQAEKKKMGAALAPKTAQGASPSSGALAVTPNHPSALEMPPTHFDTEAYDHIPENDFVAVADDPMSTFSIDVDTASYSNMRRFLREGRLPPADAVRIEELVNYFEYDYAQPTGEHPFSVTAEVGECPWNRDHRLVHVGLQGKAIDATEVPARNLVFLIDVSGSMSSHDKLPLLQHGLGMLADRIRRQDRVSIVVYAGASGLVLPPTADRHAIKKALTGLRSGGSTNGGAGIQLAYEVAERNFIRGGINRVILATDGDFNVGVTSQGSLTRLIENKRRGGVFLSVLGFGTGNLQDATMEQIADKGNGNYAYIDSAQEAHKVLVQQASGTLMTIAKDVKLQLEFNPAQVSAYRLVGYENRKLADEEFNDDTKDAGEIGAGHTVTALYEIVPAGSGGARPKVDPLKYQRSDTAPTRAAASGEVLEVKIRYKRPDGHRSRLLRVAVRDSDRTLAQSSEDFRFSAAVAELGMLLRQSRHRGEATFAQVHDLARNAKRHDPNGHRAEFLDLVERAARIAGGRQARLRRAR